MFQQFCEIRSIQLFIKVPGGRPLHRPSPLCVALPSQLRYVDKVNKFFTAVPSIRSLHTILKNGQDRLPGAAVQEGQRNDRQHGITRGAAYFRKGGMSK